jgi:hypothetical protein
MKFLNNFIKLSLCLTEITLRLDYKAQPINVNTEVNSVYLRIIQNSQIASGKMQNVFNAYGGDTYGNHCALRVKRY